MGFSADKAVSKLDWDFKPYVDASGTSPEPSGDAIGEYWAEYMAMLRQSQQMLQDFQDRRNAITDDDKMSREEKVDKLKALDIEFDAYQKKQAKERLSQRVDLLAKLLNNVPSAEQMHELPGRIFDAYEVSIQEELSPKGLTNATNN